MKRWKLIVGISLIFTLGFIAGSLGMGLYLKHREFPYRGDAKDRKAFVVEKLSRELDLTEDQRRRFEKIFDGLEKRWREVRAELKKIRADGISQMKKELNPEQQKKLDQLHQAFERRKKEKKWN